MNDPTQTNDPNQRSPLDANATSSAGGDSETPPLFDFEQNGPETVDTSSPSSQDDSQNPCQNPCQNPSQSEDSGPEDESTPTPSTGSGSQPESLQDLATRLPQDHPPKWAMNWRPTGEEEDEEIPGDHHPARRAGSAEDHPAEDRPAEQHSAESDPAPSTPGPMNQAAVGPDEDVVESAADGSIHTETDFAEGLPPQSGERGPDSNHPAPPPRTGGGQLGWVAAAIVALAWIGVELGTQPAEQAPVAAEASTEDPTLARPAPDPSRMVLLEEVSLLTNEVEVLRSEVEAATILRNDHERISTELARLERRRMVTLDQLLYLEASLERERQERAALASELDLAQRFLDDVRTTD